MSEKYTPVLIVLLVIASFAIGSMWTKIQYLQQGAGQKTQGTGAQVAGVQQVAQPTQPAAPTITLDKIKALFSKDHIVLGNANSKVLFVEISDPSCPFCHYAGGANPELSKSSGRFQYVTDGGSYNPPVTEIKKLVDAGKAGFVWLFSPGHGNGELGAQALYCANEQGKFWAVHNLLMSNKGYDLMNNTVQNNKANIPQLVQFLAPAIDSTFMSDCLTNGKYAAKITADEQTAQTLGFNGTPDFFVNTTNFNGAVDYKAQMEPVVKPLLN